MALGYESIIHGVEPNDMNGSGENPTDTIHKSSSISLDPLLDDFEPLMSEEDDYSAEKNADEIINAIAFVDGLIKPHPRKKMVSFIREAVRDFIYSRDTSFDYGDEIGEEWGCNDECDFDDEYEIKVEPIIPNSGKDIKQPLSELGDGSAMDERVDTGVEYGTHIIALLINQIEGFYILEEEDGKHYEQEGKDNSLEDQIRESLNDQNISFGNVYDSKVKVVSSNVDDELYEGVAAEVFKILYVLQGAKFYDRDNIDEVPDTNMLRETIAFALDYFDPETLSEGDEYEDLLNHIHNLVLLFFKSIEHYAL